MQVHLQENVGAVHILSGSGNVEIAVTPQAHVTAHILGAGKVSCSVAGGWCVLVGGWVFIISLRAT